MEYVKLSTIEKLAEDGDTDALMTMAVLYRNGMFFERDDEKSVECLKRSAENDSEDACFILSLMHDFGYIVDEDEDEARRYLEKAAELGNAQAMRSLAYDAVSGTESQDFETFVLWLEKAAEHDDPLSCYDLGVYWSEHGDFEKARGYYERACQKGNGIACYNLGVMYYNGDGVEKDRARARRLFQKAAELRFGRGYTGLGILSIYGLAEKANHKRGVKFLKKGAALYDPDACHMLSDIFAEGKIAEKDPDQAERYGLMSDKYGYYYAKRPEDSLKGLDRTGTRKRLLELFFNQFRAFGW